ncbi:MAG: DUF4157 domain-containing protein [Nitrosomonas sp.]|nr:DUF4157 domain-containing protein [Nitrosomonas sp.]MCW5607742.1 DUF4157 domain-containing protein [Nitrosomonas sp.]
MKRSLPKETGHHQNTQAPHPVIGNSPVNQAFIDNRQSTKSQQQLMSAMENSPQAIAQRQRIEQIHNSPRMIAQRQLITTTTGAPIQLMHNDEELVQGKLDTVQRIEDEDPLQGKSDPVQRMEEDELIQGKSKTAQYIEDKNEHPQDNPDTPRRKTGLAEKQNNTGLPDNLKQGIEQLSGLSMDHVNVHYNSSRPAQLNAHAYAQGTEIHLAPGQEQHLPHEAWHIVQQAQGRVKPTMQMKSGVSVNDDEGLEHEADVMGARAISNGTMPSEKKQLTEPAAFTDGETIGHLQASQLSPTPAPESAVMQGKWAELENNQWPQETVDHLKHGTILNIKRGFFRFLDTLGGYDGQKAQIQDAINTYPDQSNGNPLFRAISEYLRDTYNSGDLYSANQIVNTILEMTRHPLVDTKILKTAEESGAEIDYDQIDESDHGGDTDTPEEFIDWIELTSQGLIRIPHPVLFQIFYNLALYHCIKANTPLPAEDILIDRYHQWRSGGIFTRSRFKAMLGIQPQQSDETRQIIQRARKGNTFSFNTNYVGNYTGTAYSNVIYYRDSGGNIAFETNPKTIITRFNTHEGENISASNVVWSSPVVNASKIQMRNDLTDKEQGIMPSGKKVKLKNASRAQHFAIADMLYPNSRGGTLTWHHLTEHYKMILVDMKVHAKHGHNGGVHLWK